MAIASRAFRRSRSSIRSCLDLDQVRYQGKHEHVLSQRLTTAAFATGFLAEFDTLTNVCIAVIRDFTIGYPTVSTSFSVMPQRTFEGADRHRIVSAREHFF